MSQIKVELISPFVQGAKETFESYANLRIRRKDLYLKHGYRMYGDTSGIIGLSGTTCGTCAISLPDVAAGYVVRRMLMMAEDAALDPVEMRDGVGELVNMIAGRAKAILSPTQYKFDVTLPTIISGEEHEFFQKKETHCVVVLFETENKGCFTLEVCVASR